MRSTHTKLAVVAAAILACAAACVVNGPTTVSIADNTNQTITALQGEDVNITLQVTGAGVFDSIPAVSTANVRFVDESQVYPAVAVGPTQLFRFKAVTVGTAIVDFVNRPQGITVEDTIVVH